ncbi:Fic family protein [Mycolicibacter longobardus]|uniref:Filamentation induced by cAMP protein fic n=2 Tax=Mycolicibacter longobardus TaxID=1108812 RepID=A0A1X1YAA1_9MYCO|nr:Fic family protein [Mycolicibacter longobardus]ORW07951.1 filamentation induced by cAMP protein fic [Mycolicibacter longobardus]
MQVELFENSPVGTLVPISGMDHLLGEAYSHYAFVPEPLPDDIQLAARSVKVLEEAARALGRLDSKIQLLPNPNLLVRPSLRKEAVSTTALEGTFAPLSEALGADYVDEQHQSAEIREVMNYVRAATLSMQMLDELPICLKMLGQLQATLVRGTRGDAYDAGELRQRQVCIGQQGGGVDASRFVPPPNGDILVAGVSDWEKWVNKSDDLPLLVKVALAHYQFETLHPFSDGNGRLGRLIITLQLMQAGVLKYPILNLSPWLEPRRERYIDHLLEVSMTGQFEPWINFFCQAVVARADAATETIAAMLDVREQFAEELRADGATGMVLQLASDLIGFPYISAGEAAELYGVAYPTANNAIARLVKLGILEEITGREYGRIFRCPRVYEIIARA